MFAKRKNTFLLLLFAPYVQLYINLFTLCIFKYRIYSKKRRGAYKNYSTYRGGEYSEYLTSAFISNFLFAKNSFTSFFFLFSTLFCSIR